ncbi:acyltransferase [Conexibacter sp. SYSU D00693]|uniref:acyltransferase family protein n=1 Tax=Conexibacter sp. SYSU D00693 TaxID=2812560 RepID=UPI00196A70E2|nr:acyltransferase [Conexibacter sp. SYSU D00693]
MGVGTFGGDGAAARPERERFVLGDPIRGIACLLILVYHSAHIVSVQRGGQGLLGGTYGAPGSVMNLFDLSLYVFFVLSGFLIARPWVAAFVRGERRPSTRRYLTARALRIFPAFWAIFALFALVNSTYGDSFDQILSAMALQQQYHSGLGTQIWMAQGWTLGLEFTFYLLVPVAGWALAQLAARRWSSTSARVRIVLGLCAALFALSFASRLLGPQTITFQRALPALLMFFLPGVALAAVEQVARPALRAHPGRARVLALGLLGLAVVGLGGYHLSKHDIPGFHPEAAESRAVWGALVAGTLVAAPLVWQWAGLRAWRVMDRKPLHWVGERSLSIYLLHAGVWDVLSLKGATWRPLWTDFALHAGATLALTIPLAALTFALVERPAMERRLPLRRLRRRVVAPRTPARPAVAEQLA